MGEGVTGRGDPRRAREGLEGKAGGGERREMGRRRGIERLICTKK